MKDQSTPKPPGLPQKTRHSPYRQENSLRLSTETLKFDCTEELLDSMIQTISYSRLDSGSVRFRMSKIVTYVVILIMILY